ncbi:MAG: hypothetical protein IPP48_11250 [Chitinophagaceae bacterium]|nr:hypothetical protein [Chitinophagaceae bacterium]
MVVAGIVLLFIIFVSIALSILIGIWLGTMWLGFLIMAGIYMLLGLVVWTARGKIIRLPVMNSIIQQLFKHDEED